MPVLSEQIRTSQRALGPLLVHGNMSLHNRWILSFASWAMPWHVAPVETGISSPKGRKEAVPKPLMLVAQAHPKVRPVKIRLFDQDGLQARQLGWGSGSSSRHREQAWAKAVRPPSIELIPCISSVAVSVQSSGNATMRLDYCEVSQCGSPAECDMVGCALRAI